MALGVQVAFVEVVPGPGGAVDERRRLDRQGQIAAENRGGARPARRLAANQRVDFGSALAGDDNPDAVDQDRPPALDRLGRHILEAQPGGEFGKRGDIGGVSHRGALRCASASGSGRSAGRSATVPTGRCGTSVRPSRRRASPVGRRVSSPSGRRSTTTTMIRP